MSLRSPSLKALAELVDFGEGSKVAVFRKNLSQGRKFVLEAPDGKIMPIGNKTTAEAICKSYGWKLLDQSGSSVSEFFDDSDPHYPDEVNVDPKDGGSITITTGNDELEDSNDDAIEFLKGHLKELGVTKVEEDEEDDQTYYDIKFKDGSSASLTILPPKSEDDQVVPALVVLLGPDGTLEDWPIPEEAIGEDDTVSISGLNIDSIKRTLEEMMRNSKEEDGDDEEDDSDEDSDSDDDDVDDKQKGADKFHKGLKKDLKKFRGEKDEAYLGPKLEAYRFVVRQGKRVRKKVVRRRKKRLSSKQKFALRKARRAAHRGGANRKRRKSQTVRRRMHLKSGGLGRNMKLAS